MVVWTRVLSGFLEDDEGAITTDWVALTASILLLGIAVVFAVFSNGVGPLVATTNDRLSSANAGVCNELEANLGLADGDCESFLND